MMVSVLGVEGSPRKRGNSHILLNTILTGVEDSGLKVHKVHLRDYKYASCIGCEQCRKNGQCSGQKDGMTLLYPLIEDSKALVLISPVHNYNVSAWVKAFIDRMYCYYAFADTRPRQWRSRLAGQGRKAVIAAIAEQTEKENMGFTLDAMRLPLEALGYEIISEIPVMQLFDRGIIAKHQEYLDQAWEAGSRLAAELKSV